VNRIRTLLVAALIAAVPFIPAVAQIPGAELTQVQATREALQDLLSRLDAAASSGTYSGELRARARELAARVRQRLTEGDFQAGDRVYIRVEGESSLVDTFTVRGGRLLDLRQAGSVSLQGVLRSELNDHLTRYLSQYLRNPVVHAQSLVRVTVMGGVAHQGFYTLPVDVPINDVIMAAGGPTPYAHIDKIRISRGHEQLLVGDQVERVITLGLTLDALGIQAGDRIEVPETNPQLEQRFYRRMQFFNFILTLPITLYGLVKLIESF
jgi:SLBB domain-containing protein/polysaccharide biosynthesis/export protein